jgi:hypothetical protein
MKTTAICFVLLIALAPCSFALLLPNPEVCTRDNVCVSGIPSSKREATRVSMILPVQKALLNDAALLPAGVGEAAELGAEANAREWMKSGSISFTPNLGQLADSEGRTRPDLLYTADVSGVRLYFKADGVSYVFTKSEESEEKSVSEATGSEIPSDNTFGSTLRSTESMKSTTSYRMDMTFEGCNTHATLRGEGTLPSYTNYYLAHCPDGITHVKSYAKIVYENIYDNIDLAYYASLGSLKYEFIVRPGGDPNDIRLRYSGDTDMRIGDDGGLEIATPLGSITEQAPVTFQEQRSIQSRFLLEGDELRFDVGEYDADKVLVIDPWGTYLGGSGDDLAGSTNFPTRVSCDASGNIFVGGTTSSTNFPVLSAYQPSKTGNNDLFIVKFDPYGVRLWSTYYGGSGNDSGSCAAASDTAGNVIVVAETSSTDFPASTGAYQTTFGGGSTDFAIVKLDGTGSRLWATYYGGNGKDDGHAIATDGNANVIVVGETNNNNFPVLNAFQSAYGGGIRDMAIVKLSSSGQPLWATFYGGSGPEQCWGVDCDGNGNIIVSAGSGSTNFPISAGAYQTQLAGTQDAVLVKLNAAGGREWATYLGGPNSDYGGPLCCDPSGNIILTGNAGSNFPILNAYQSTGSGLFLSKFSDSGSLIWSTYFGYAGSVCCIYCVTCNSSGTIFFGCGWLYANTSMPVLNAVFPTQGDNGGFIASLSASCQLLWGTYWGSTAGEVHGIALGLNGDVIVAGCTKGTTYPVLNAQQGSFGGGIWDAFVSSLTSGGVYPVELSTLSATPIGTDIHINWKTEMETNNVGFIIERSADKDAAAWEQRGFIPTASGTGPHGYRFVDRQPADWTQGQPLYYRLRQMDVDGRETVSPVVAVNMGTAEENFRLGSPFPNPAANESWFAISLPDAQTVSLRLCDALGRCVRTVRDDMELAAGTHVIRIPVGDLPAGVYYVNAMRGSAVDTRRIVVRR